MEYKRINDEIEEVKGIKMLAQAYEEISVIKIQWTRNSVMKTRDYLSELSEVFYDVRRAYQATIERLIKEKKLKPGTTFSTLPKNGKSILLLVSANSKLYGEIVPKTFRLFLEQVKNSNDDLCIVGSMGKDLFDQTNIKKEYLYYDIPDARRDFAILRPLISHIIKYEKVTVFYGKFVNIVNQVPTSSEISGSETFSQASPQVTHNKYLFEPSIKDIYSFFETQIFSYLFKQTIHESQLARYASRIKAMEQALEHIDGTANGLRAQKRRLKNLIDNKKQLSTIAGISLWSTR